MSSSLKFYIEILIKGDRHLSASETEAAFSIILSGADEIQVGSFLTLLRARRETPNEIAGMVHAMNSVCNHVDLSEKKILDIVGTGGDCSDTINISSVSAVLAAACGCIVAKSGNRSVSSKCGSADVLEKLGVKTQLDPKSIAKCVDDCGIAFMFAPINHPTMQLVAPIRKKLGVRTCFNILGPLINAARAQHIVIGVFHEDLMDLVVGALKEISIVDHAVVIHGVGLDEISPLGPAAIREIRNIALYGEPKHYEEFFFSFDPLDVGIPRCKVEDLRGDDPAVNAKEFIAVLNGGSHTNAKRDAVVLNAGVGCYVYGKTSSIREGVDLARNVLNSGKALDKLHQWILCSQKL